MPASVTTEKFIEKAKEIHGDRYDYSKTLYIRAHEKVIITCLEHGDFEQTPDNHCRKKGCPSCKIKLLSNVKKSNTEEFIAKSNKQHNNKYSYDKTIYKGVGHKVTITCPEHGDFTQTAGSHLSGCGCPSCSLNNKRGKRRKITKEEFINESNLLYDSKYSYENIDFKGITHKVSITCPEHGVFEKQPYLHLKGEGCPFCVGRKLNTQVFIHKANKKHNNKYNYDKVIYKNCINYITITCPEHGDFNQKPSQHLSGQGCPKCGNSYTLNLQEFICLANKTHNNKYTYDKSHYNDAHTKTCITCPDHGDFYQDVTNHLRGVGCSECAGITRYNKEIFIEKCREIHGDTYEYSNVDFVNTKTRVKITCKKHGDFTQAPENHLKGSGCPLCVNKSEGMFHDYAKNFFPRIEKRVRPKGTKLPMDTYTPEINTYNEVDGIQHFEDSPFFKTRTAEENRNHDVTKMIIALRDEGRSVIRIYQPWVWRDKGDWQKKWRDAVSMIDQDKPAVYFIGPEGTYDKHKEDLRWKLGNRFEMKSIV